MNGYHAPDERDDQEAHREGHDVRCEYRRTDAMIEILIVDTKDTKNRRISINSYGHAKTEVCNASLGNRQLLQPCKG